MSDTRQTISFHPSFLSINRASAESLLSPEFPFILRPSSVSGCYAVSYRLRDTAIHHLLRENADGSIDCLNDSLAIYSTFSSLQALLQRITELLETQDVVPATGDPTRCAST